MRYRQLGKDHWFPGNQAARIDDAALARCLQASPHAERIPGLLREAHEMLK
jgi:predicted aldo/keto reductase-like oxidoreductase